MVSTMKNHGCWDRIGEDEKVKTVTKNRNSQVDKMCSSRSRRSSFIVVDHAVFFHQLFYYKFHLTPQGDVTEKITTGLNHHSFIFPVLLLI